MSRRSLYFLPPDSPAAQRLLQRAWAHHPLGPPEAWPPQLKATLATLLRSPQPMLLWWGRSLVHFANDAFAAAYPAEHAAIEADGIGARVEARFVPDGLRQALGGKALAKPGLPGSNVLYAPSPWSPVFDPVGSLAGGLCVFNRRTQRDRVEEDVAEVLERMTDSFFVLDRHWTILRVNSRHVALTHRTEEDQVGRNFLEIFLPDQAAQQNSQYYAQYLRVMQEGTPVHFEEYYAPLQLWTECHVYPTAKGGIAVFCRDISATKRAEEKLSCQKQKFEAVFLTAPAAMALTRGEDLVFESHNARYRALVGERDVLGRKSEDVFLELAGSPYFDVMRGVLRSGRPRIYEEQSMELIVHKGAAPEPRYLDFVYTCIHNAAGAPYGVFIYAEDVTDRVKRRQKLVGALHARDELLSICSHELKTPVASMKLSTQTFKRGLARKDPRITSPERVERMFEQSDRQLDRLTRLIDDMLDFSRMSGGRLQLTPAPCCAATIIQATLDRLRPQLVAAGAQASLTWQGDAHGAWDRGRLEQLVSNLLINALKYGGSKPIEAVLRGTASRITLEVRDTGPGIREADQSRIFEPYERAVAVTNISGLGLGLYICRQIAEAHGGSLTVRSAPGHGATFVVDLPKQRLGPAGPA